MVGLLVLAKVFLQVRGKGSVAKTLSKLICHPGLCRS